MLVERHQASSASPEANESAVEVEEGLLPLLPDIDDAEGTRQFLIEYLQQYDDPGAADLRDALLEGDMSGVDLRDALLREGEIAAVLRDALLREGDMGSLVEELPDIDDVEKMEGLPADNDPLLLPEIAYEPPPWPPIEWPPPVPPADDDPRLIESVVDFVRSLAVGKLAVGNALADHITGTVGTDELPGTGGPIGGGGSEPAEPDVPDLDVPLPG